MKWFILALKKYADFNGRARRKEYWWFTVIAILFSSIIFGIEYLLERGTGTHYGEWLGTVYWWALLIPTWAVGVRRFHDIGKSGWLYAAFVAVSYTLYISFLIYLISLLVGHFGKEEAMHCLSLWIGTTDYKELSNWLNSTSAGVAVPREKILIAVLVFVVAILALGIWYLILLFRDSAPGENKWGANPKEVLVEDMVV